MNGMPSPLISRTRSISGASDTPLLDTVNRLFLHGMANRRRDAAFLHWTRRTGHASGARGAESPVGEGWRAIPDWRAERTVLRLSLAARLHLGLERGDRVALWLPLSPAFVFVERAVWMFGSITLPLNPSAVHEDLARPLHETGPRAIVLPDTTALGRLHEAGALPRSIRAALILRGRIRKGNFFEGISVLAYERMVELGAGLATETHISQLRAEALGIVPGDPLTLECRDGAPTACVLFSHRSMISQMRDRPEESPPGRRVHFVETFEPLRSVRAMIYATWAGGTAAVAFPSPERSGSGPGRVPAGRPSSLREIPVDRV